MQSNSKHILLISYVFPPHYGIGGRRWSKHAEALTNHGYTVHVICAKNPFPENSLWYEKVRSNKNIILYQLPTMYPSVLVNFKHNILQKILYKFYVTILPLLTKGSYLDRTIFWKRVMLKKAKTIIKENNIKHIISTGGPFGTMYYATLLRKYFNDLFILNDLRDPWTWGPNWGYPNLSPERMKFEKYREFETIRNSDLISTPSDDMVNYLKLNYPNYSNKFIQISHFFDPEDIHIQPKTSSSIVRLVMYGNIYHDIEKYIIKAAKLFANYKGKVTLDIYTDKIQNEVYFRNEGATNVKFYPQQSLKVLFDKFGNYDFVFLFNPKYNINNISTKFYEIIYSKTPIFLFCEYGLGPKFLIENNLGICADLESVDRVFEKMVNGNLQLNYNSNYDVSPYTLGKVTESIANILDSGNNYHGCDTLTKKSMLLTFDYELFLGEDSGSVYNSILKPTEVILESFKRLGLKNAMFFVDTLYIKRLQETENTNAQKDLEQIFKQLVNVLKQGHYIYPHIHTHWYNATYNSLFNQWDLSDLSLYRFHSVTSQQQEECFEFSIEFISKIQKEASVYYDIDCYRAGGWCIQPFDVFRPYFLKYGIKNDFSVLKNFKLNHNDSFYNFESFPSKSIYRFGEDISTISPKGAFKEYSITSISFSATKKIMNRIFLKFANKLNYVNYGDGKSARRINDFSLDETSENVYNTRQDIEMTSIELMTSVKLGDYMNYIKSNHFVHFISHPKMISKHNIYCFEKFIKFAKQNFDIETDYKKMD